MQATLVHVGADVLCRSPGASPEELRIDGEDFLPLLQGWASRYDRAVRQARDDDLYPLGCEMFGALDSNGWASAWARTSGPRGLEIRVDDAELPLARALLDAPWELLAAGGSHLADDTSQLFAVARRIGKAQEPLPPQHADLQLMFMAAAPEGEQELDFEAEEAAILQATERLPLHLVVEESGALEPLADRLASSGPYEALHLSCHGGIDRHAGPFLGFEREQGGLHAVSAGDLARALGEPGRTALVFVSACRTAELANDANDRPLEPLVRNLVRAGVANVVGWDGSVFDHDAIGFATHFYRELSRHGSLVRASALARHQLRIEQLRDPRRGLHWHLARLYLGAHGGGALVAAGKPKRKLASTSHANPFLDAERSEVPVASREAFVGRRRQIQSVLRAFAAGSVGVLVHGMGNLGKSSLAHRIASRLSGHRCVVVFRHYDSLAIFDRLLAAVPAGERRALSETWRSALADDETLLADALEELLGDVFDRQPILLVIDDLERTLQTSGNGSTAASVVPQFRAALGAVLGAFARVATASRLLLTSRYRFSLPDAHGKDLAAALCRVPLRPMTQREQRKQWRAVEQRAASSTAREATRASDADLVQRALAAADGNPGLQSVLTEPLLAGEDEAAANAITVIESFKRSGAPPESLAELIAAGVAGDEANALLAFFKRMAFRSYRDALSETQARWLSVACSFGAGVPVPLAVVATGGKAIGLDAAEDSLARLLALGLLDDWGVLHTESAAASTSANPLARPLAAELASEEIAAVADATAPLLAQAWSDSRGELPRDERSLELVLLALIAPNVPVSLVDRAAAMAAVYLFRGENDPRRAINEVLVPTWQRLASAHQPPSQVLARIAFDCAEHCGEVNLQRASVDALAGAPSDDDLTAGSALLRLARASQRIGNLDQAETLLHAAAKRLAAAGAERDHAIVRGQIADILHARGQFDEALRIRTEEELPVHERLGDVREKDVTMSKIAEIMQERGQLEEALALHQQRLPMAEAMRNAQGIAQVHFSIARIQLELGEHERGGLQAIYEHLDTSFSISMQTQQADAIAVMGALLAQVLAMGGQDDYAIEVLEHAESAATKVGFQKTIEVIRQVRSLIETSAS